MATVSIAVPAQEKENYKEIILSKRIQINAPADEVWEVVGPGFGDAHIWASTVDHAVTSGEPEFEGASCSSRSCDLNVKGFSHIKEEITIYD